MAIQPWMTAAQWADRVSVFREDPRDADENGDIPGLRAVTAAQNVLCRKHDTDNYDSLTGDVAQSKMNNIMTSDKVVMPMGTDVRAEDIVRIDLADGRVEWFTVAGAPKNRALTVYTKAFLTTTTAPNILAGSWNE